jgi:hypothetical protein
VHKKHAVQRECWLPTQNLLQDRGKLRKTLIDLALRVQEPTFFSKYQAPTAQYTHFSLPHTIQLMPYREIIAVCSEIHIQHIHTLCGKEEEILNVKLVAHEVINGT